MTESRAVTLPHGTSDLPYDVVALATSAGGLEALSAVLRDLPPDFPAAVIVHQHLSRHGSALVSILARRTHLPIAWATDGAAISRGQICIGPPRTRLEILPDWTCALSPNERGALDYPLDSFLTSLADSFGRRVLVVVLTGMGKDGAAGALAIRRAGGTVLVQSESTAEQPAMPRAAIDAGAADLVLPLDEIGAVIADVVQGGRLPRPRTEIEATDALFAGAGEVSILLRQIDWSRTPLGPVSTWPTSLRTALRVVLESPVPMIVLWGLDHVQLYNDHYRLLMGDKHPIGLGQTNRECWPEVWHLNAPVFERVFLGEPVALESALFPITRHGAPEDAWFNMYFSPIRDEEDGVAGVLATVVETTRQVLYERRLRTLHQLAAEATGAASPHAALRRAIIPLARNQQDLPFALGYLLDATGSLASLVAAHGVEAGSPLAPRTLRARSGDSAWPLARVLREEAPVVLDDLIDRFRGHLAGPGPESLTSAVLLPLFSVGEEHPPGVLIVGLNPRLPFDTAYRTFLDLVAAQVSKGLAEALVRFKERESSERLTELDRAKTEFFSNVSHEFRTPLTLLLGPLEELLGNQAELPEPVARELELAARNARRLLALVDTLLDFSQLEAGRLRAHVEPTDLARLTADVASVFRSPAERAGLTFRVVCPRLPEPVWVDREMWEKIVSNLLANALKFTFAGEISIVLRPLPQHVELVVRDTGVGIPPADLPHIFERFHRVRETRARTHEGAGVGLALVHELVRLLNGRVRAQSCVGEGTTITAWIPLGKREETGASLGPPAPERATDIAALAAEEVGRWEGIAPRSASPPIGVLDDPLGLPIGSPLRPPANAWVLVVDDNPDLRDYLRRLLSPHWHVSTAADGEAALERARAIRPHLILADAKLPGLDGFGLLRRLRDDPTLKATPVILLTARAGEEAEIDGIPAGADDYLTKPFTARELVARVGAQLQLARVRQEATDRLRRSEERFRAFVTASSDVVYRMSPIWGELRQLEGRAFIPDSDHPSQTWIETYILPEDRPRVREVIDEAIRTKSIFELEHRVRRIDGTLGWTFSRAVPLLNEQGEIVEWIGTAKDVTARKQAEAGYPCQH